MSDLTWSDIAYQEEHGYLPDKGMTATEMEEYYGNPSNGDYDPDEVRASVHAVAEERLMQENRRLRERVEDLESDLQSAADEIRRLRER